MQASRRQFLFSALGSGLLISGCAAPESADSGGADGGAQLDIGEFEPTSMLKVPVTEVPRARFPAIDAHTHVNWLFDQHNAPLEGPLPQAAAEELDQIVAWMDELNIQTMINLTGGAGAELERNVRDLEQRHPGRFVICTEPTWDRAGEPGYASWQAAELERAHQAGAKGLKLLKTLGVGLRENGGEGPLVPVDDPRFNPTWETAGKLGMPVFIHTADPDAFYTPTDRFNERWEELGNHPEWSYYGADFPPKDEMLAARNRVIERHPQTTFVCLHVANRSENLDDVSEWLDRYPNMNIEIGARLGELGRQPRRSRKFFEDYQDRILFGTDAVPNGHEYPQQVLIPEMFQCYFRFLESEDEYFDYSPAATPPQGRWKIYGIGLPDEILRKVYHNNAARILGLEAV